MRRVIIALVAVGLMVTTLPALAHTDEELIEWQEGWEARVFERGSLSVQLMAERTEMYDRHPCRAVLGLSCETTQSHSTPDASPTLSTHGHTGMGSGVEMWRGLVEAHFGANTNAALRVMACESGGNAHAMHPRSRASGLFQFLPSTWERTMGESYPGGVFDGNRNIEAAAILSGGGTNWSQWSCKP